MGRRVFALPAVVCAVLCLASASPARPPPRVTRVVVKKWPHTLTLYADGAVVKTYRVAIGPGGPGFKRQEGDQVTPVGHYHVVSRQPSQFHVFMRLDYPSKEDWARFARLKASGALSKKATIGGDIGIHGAPPQPEWKAIHKTVDWTLGCIAVDDDEIEEIARLVKDGTPVDIEDGPPPSP